MSLANDSFLPILIKSRELVDGYRFHSRRLGSTVVVEYFVPREKIGSS